MPAYVVAYVKVTDPQAMAAYGSAVIEVTERFGGRYLFVGPGAEVLDGDWPLDGMAIIEFPDGEAARRWHQSAEYAPLIELRHAAGATAMVLTPDV
jgi:uncharacterized protein (DUF1330 family)